MFIKGEWFKAGWLYFIIMFALEAVLPDWVGDENGVIENLQMLWLFGAFYLCVKAQNTQMCNWGGHTASLWRGGMIYFFLLIMREINWGRTLLTHPDGSYYQYSDMGLYGQLVHPLVGVLLVALLVNLWRGRVWRFLQLVKVPALDFALLLLFILMAWVGEKANFTGFHGMVGEELAEFGAYMMMFRLLKTSIYRATKL